MCLSKTSVERLLRMIPTGFEKILMQLHWLLVYFSVQYKILLLTWRAFHVQALVYIRELLHPCVPRGPVTRAGSRRPTLSWTQKDQSRVFSGPTLWNSLFGLQISRLQLKTYCFKPVLYSCFFMHCWLLWSTLWLYFLKGAIKFYLLPLGSNYGNISTTSSALCTSD